MSIEVLNIPTYITVSYIQLLYAKTDFSVQLKGKKR